MSWDNAVAALNALKARGTGIITFEGGEPLLWRDGKYRLHDLVDYAKRRFLRVAVTTNGTLRLDVPADVVWVSIDGLRETHNRLRSASFDRLWHNLSTATGPARLMVHFTLNRLNWRELEGVARKLKELPAVKGLSLQIFYPYGQGESDLALAGEERRAALEWAIELKKSYPIINSARCLRSMIRNDWRCRDDLLINVDPDSRISQGCYVKGRGRIECGQCGFTPIAEASAALSLRPTSLLTGWQAYLSSAE